MFAQVRPDGKCVLLWYKKGQLLTCQTILTDFVYAINREKRRQKLQNLCTLGVIWLYLREIKQIVFKGGLNVNAILPHFTWL